MVSRRAVRTFLYTFILALCVLGLLCACVVIECTMRHTVSGRADLGVRYRLQPDGLEIAANGTVWRAPRSDAVEAALSPPVRLVLEVWRWGNRLAARLW